MAGSISLPLYPRPAAGGVDQKLTVSTVALSFATFSATGSIDVVMVDVQNQDVMVTFDGSTPTSSNGHHLVAGEKFTWSRAMAEAAKFIRQGGTDGVVHGTPCQI